MKTQKNTKENQLVLRSFLDDSLFVSLLPATEAKLNPNTTLICSDDQKSAMIRIHTKDQTNISVNGKAISHIAHVSAGDLIEMSGEPYSLLESDSVVFHQKTKVDQQSDCFKKYQKLLASHSPYFEIKFPKEKRSDASYAPSKSQEKKGTLTPYILSAACIVGLLGSWMIHYSKSTAMNQEVVALKQQLGNLSQNSQKASPQKTSTLESLIQDDIKKTKKKTPTSIKSKSPVASQEASIGVSLSGQHTSRQKTGKHRAKIDGKLNDSLKQEFMEYSLEARVSPENARNKLKYLLQKTPRHYPIYKDINLKINSL